jgi:hypothetical protein
MKIVKVWFDDHNIYVITDSGHTVGNPIEWYPRLAKANPKELEHYEIGTFGDSIHWEQLDEDLSLEGFFDFQRVLNYARL